MILVSQHTIEWRKVIRDFSRRISRQGTRQAAQVAKLSCVAGKPGGYFHRGTAGREQSAEAGDSQDREKIDK